MRALKRVAAWTMTVALVIGGVNAAGSAASAAEAVPQSVGEASASVASVADSVVKTADLSKFQPGNIISDAAFFNSGTMSEVQIQSFLQSKVPTCQSGYTCLKDWYDTSRTTSADAMCGAYSGGIRERASTIIFKVAQACGINPQVLLVMLQKEQGLVTHTWPSDFRYQAAMGQGCPDTAACDTRYYGFFNQMYGAAWQMKRYANPAGTSQYFTWYAPGKTWNVRWHPNEGCGSSPVYIQNQATANLYYYTPYQPNAAAIRAGYGEGDGCSSYGNRNFFQYFDDWFGSTRAGLSPFGNVEVIEAKPGIFRVAGWAIDPDTTSPISVHVYVGAVGSAVRADIARADVGGAYPAFGSAHGFDVEVAATGESPVSVCVYAIDSGGGSPVVLRCQTLDAKTGAPVGALETVTPGTGTVDVVGWAVDPDSVAPTSVHVYVGSTGTAINADVSRTDMSTKAPGYGAGHGFSARLTAPPGVHTVCVYAINTGPGATTPLGCKTVTVLGTTDQGRPPIGQFESLTLNGSTATTVGWAIDPDTSAPIAVHLYVGAVGKAYTADKARTDIAATYPDAGANHGFSESFEVPPGTSQVCAYAINTGAGGHTLLGCKTATVSTTADLGRAPFGNIDSLSVSGDTATVSGWTLDSDTPTTTLKIHVYVGSVGAEYSADQSRPDVGAAYPGTGTNHGFAAQVKVPVGSSQICVYAINSGPGGHTLLGCRTANVVSTAPDLGRAPFGNLESVTASAGGATVSGWAIDPDTSASIKIHIYVDAVGAEYAADEARSDVGAIYPSAGSAHGFNESVAMAPGAHNVCVYAINTGAGGHSLLGCRSVTAP